MQFTQELTCRWSTSTGTPTRLLPARSFAQKLLHRSCYTGVQLTSRWSHCIWTPAKSDFSSSSISLWRQGQPGGGLRNVTLCGASDTQTCSEMRNFFARSNHLQIVRFERPSMWWNVNFFWAPATLCRDRAGRTSKHVAKCKFGGTRRSPLGSTVKKLV